MKKTIRKPYSTSLDPRTIKTIKLLAIEKNTTDNKIIETAIQQYSNQMKENGKS